METFVDDDAYKKSGYSSVDEFVCNIPEEDASLKAFELHFSLYYSIHISKMLDLLSNMKISSYCVFITNDKNSKSIYVYLIYKETD